MSDDNQAADMSGGEEATSEERDGIISAAADKAGISKDRVIDILRSMWRDSGLTAKFEDQGHKIEMATPGEYEDVMIDGVKANSDDWGDLHAKYNPIADAFNEIANLYKGSPKWMEGTVKELLD